MVYGRQRQTGHRERCIVRLNHLQSQHKRAHTGVDWREVRRVGRAVWSSVGMSHCVALYKDSELTSQCAPSAPSLTLLKPHKHTDTLQCMRRHTHTNTRDSTHVRRQSRCSQTHPNTQSASKQVSGCNSESLSSKDIAPHSCFTLG